MAHFWRKQAVDRKTWFAENQKHGSVYFAKDDERDMVKIGHSSTPFDRVRVLQTGSSGRLRLIGVMAAPRAFEATLHQAFSEGRVRGEWFFDREIISLFLHDVTDGIPLCRTAWTIVEGRSVFWEWDEASRTHVKHRFDPGSARWELAAA